MGNLTKCKNRRCKAPIEIKYIDLSTGEYNCPCCGSKFTDKRLLIPAKNNKDATSNTSQRSTTINSGNKIKGKFIFGHNITINGKTEKPNGLQILFWIVSIISCIVAISIGLNTLYGIYLKYREEPITSNSVTAPSITERTVTEPPPPPTTPIPTERTSEPVTLHTDIEEPESIPLVSSPSSGTITGITNKIAWKYIGEIFDGKANGKGKIEWSNGDYLDGDWIDWFCTNGKLYIDSSGSLYEGEFKFKNSTHFRHGIGKITLDNDNWYYGEWVNDNPTVGKGVRTGVTNGISWEYTGEFLNGKQHGTGRIDWNNGDWYDGEWANGYRHGKGTYYHAVSETSQKGEWLNDTYIG